LSDTVRVPLEPVSPLAGLTVTHTSFPFAVKGTLVGADRTTVWLAGVLPDWVVKVRAVGAAAILGALLVAVTLPEAIAITVGDVP
jgi:hypothetical protein